MAKKKDFRQWFFEHRGIFYFATAAMVACMDAILIIDDFSQSEENDTLSMITRVMAGIATVLLMYSGIMSLKYEELASFIKTVYGNSDKMYFHGFRLSRYIDTDAFLRLENWLGSGMCYELSALAMILMKNCKTARLCRGKCFDRDGNLITLHSWVEVKVPLNGWAVVDLAWIFPGFCSKKKFFSSLEDRGKYLVCEWICTHDDFWKIDFANAVSEAMQNRETSCILMELCGFGMPKDGYEFNEYIFESHDLMCTDGRAMLPHYRDDLTKPISTRIIRDFIKNPRCKSPKAKSVRLAKKWIRKYENAMQTST